MGHAPSHNTIEVNDLLLGLITSYTMEVIISNEYHSLGLILFCGFLERVAILHVTVAVSIVVLLVG
jgi:hypothetical protein